MSDKQQKTNPPKPSGEFIPPTTDYPSWSHKLNRTVYELVIELGASTPDRINVTSGYRTPDHNQRVGGVPKSAHTRGLAVDIEAVNSRQRYEILRFIIDKGICRAGVYTRHIHFDISPTKPQNVIWFECKP